MLSSGGYSDYRCKAENLISSSQYQWVTIYKYKYHEYRLVLSINYTHLGSENISQI